MLPPQLRCAYTEGQRAVLTIVAGEIKHHGVCDLPIDKIAALAGVCRTTVQTTLHEGRRLFHIKVTERPQWGRKSLTNVIKIASPEWLIWLKRGPTAHRPIGFNSAKMMNTTKSTDSDSGGRSCMSGMPRGGKREQEAVRRKPWTRSEPPTDGAGGAMEPRPQ